MNVVIIKHHSFLKRIDFLLFVAVLLMIASFFTWSDSIAISRVMKTAGRLSLLVLMIYIYRSIIAYGAIDNLRIKNPFALHFYLAYLLLALASFMWSSDVFVSALQWVMTTQCFVFSYFFIKSIYLLDAYFPEQKTRLYKLLGNAVFILSLVFAIGMHLNPDYFMRETMGGEEVRLGGLLMNPNELGMLAGVGIVSLIFNFYHKERRLWTGIKVLTMLYVLWMTGSRSSLIGVLLVTFFHLGQSKNLKLKILLISGTLIVMPVAINQIILKNDSSRLEEVLSMTGRLPFWKALITEGLPQEPWLGFGFMRIAYKDYFQGANTYPGKMTHNTFIQVLMNLGMIGFTIILFQMYFIIRGFLLEEKEKKLVLIGILIPIMINSFTEFGIFGECNFGILFYQMLIFSVIFIKNYNLTDRQKLRLRKKRPDLCFGETRMMY